MLVLAIDTSSAAVTAAVVAVDDGVPADAGRDDRIRDDRIRDDRIRDDGVRALAQRVTVDARAHGERLAPSIAECLAEAGAAPGDLDAIVAGVGPGPFTGLRVGLVTAAAMADALTVPAYGVCSLDAIAAAAPSGAAPSESRILVAADARRREVFWARYADSVRVEGPDVAKPADVSTVDSAVMAGAGARLYADVLGLPLLAVDYPDPTALVRLGAPRVRDNAPTETLNPLYLRRPDAVEPGQRKAVSQ